MTRIFSSIALSLATLITLPALGSGVSIERVEFGFSGAYKAAQWTPIAVDVRIGPDITGPVTLETVTTDAEGSAVHQEISTVDPVGRSQLRFAGVMQAGRLGSDLTVRVLDSAGAFLVDRRLRGDAVAGALPKGTQLWVMAGGFNESTTESTGEALASTLPVPDGVVAAALPAPFPERSDAYSAADLLIVRGDFLPEGRKADAVREWVASGGHLAVALGRFTNQFRDGPFADWVPIDVGETIQLRDLSRIEVFAGSDRRLPARARVRAARLGEAAEVVALGSDGPLISRSPYGFGTVTLFAIDLDDYPFATWPGRPNLIRKALVGDQPTSAKRPLVSVPGVTDLATQFMNADDMFPAVKRTTVGAALLMLLVFAAVIGPLDYLLVHRVLKRPALTWITMPVLVLLAGWWLHSAAASSNGSVSQVNQTELLDLDLETRTLRGRTATTLYATDSVRTDVVISPNVEWAMQDDAAQPRLTWFSPPETTFGGVFRDASGGLFRPDYALTSSQSSASATSVPQLNWSSRRFVASWQQVASSELVTADLVTRGRGMLEGTVSHRFPAPIEKFIVVFDNLIFANPHESIWHPGEALDLSSRALDRSDLSSTLRRRVTTRVDKKPGDSGAEFLVSDSAYDPLGTDVAAIVRLLSFNRAAGGSGYTGLTNEVLESHDLTHLMQMGRAIVLGQLELPAADVVVQPEAGAPYKFTRRSTFVRIVLPVERDEAEPPAVLPSVDANAPPADAPRPRRNRPLPN